MTTDTTRTRAALDREIARLEDLLASGRLPCGDDDRVADEIDALRAERLALVRPTEVAHASLYLESDRFTPAEIVPQAKILLAEIPGATTVRVTHWADHDDVVSAYIETDALDLDALIDATHERLTAAGIEIPSGDYGTFRR